MPDTAAMEGKRVTLARLREADAAEVIAANLASLAYHAPWVQPCRDEDGFAAWFARMASGAQVSLVVREVRSQKIAGVVNFSQIFKGNFCSAYCGFYGMAEFAGQGLMTEAMSLAMAYAFHELGLHRVEANIQPGNARSIALVRRLGFRCEGFSPRYLKIDGVWRDHERWALLVDDERGALLADDERGALLTDNER